MKPSPGKAAVLAIEDDTDIRQLLRTLLERDGYRVCEAGSGRDGLRTFHQTRPDAVILDLALPDLDGWQVLERLRELSDAPVLVLTARSAEAEKVRGLNSGADDYLTKPFSHVELLARLRAVLRRVPASAHATGFDDGHVHVDFVRHEAYVDGVPVPLTPTEYRLLSALVRHQGEVLSADRLVELAWGEQREQGGQGGQGDEAAHGELGPGRVKYAVLRLRRKLGWETEDCPLRTVRGFGYRYDGVAGRS